MASEYNVIIPMCLGRRGCFYATVTATNKDKLRHFHICTIYINAYCLPESCDAKTGTVQRSEYGLSEFGLAKCICVAEI